MGAALVALIVVVLVGISAGLCWIALQHIEENRVVAQWPVVQARITEGRVDARHQPAQGKHVSWDGWCARWNYVYEWQGAHHSGLVDDDTPSTFASGCFAYEAGARRALARRGPGSMLLVRVDPKQPWHSTTQSVGIKADDVFLLAFALAPLGIVAWFVSMMLRSGRVFRTTPSDRPPATP